MSAPGEARSQRLDKWLWHARLAPTRSAAQRLIAEGGVRLNREKAGSSARPIRVGDTLTLATARAVRVLRVAALSDRRLGPAPAAALYRDITAGERVPPDREKEQRNGSVSSAMRRTVP